MAAVKVNIPHIGKPRVVIVGAGFGGLTLARKLCRLDYQVVLIDRNNYHQFQPLFYQVAMAGLEPSAISFPLRKIFRKQSNVFIRITTVTKVVPAEKKIYTTLGHLSYDHLVLSMGADTNFFGNEDIARNALPMKSVGEALHLRNEILNDYERALSTIDYDSRQKLIDIVIVGGGPTGVEVAGALAEMKKYVIPKEYTEIDAKEIDIYLVQGGDRLLPGMSESASKKSEEFLAGLGVIIKKNCRVTGIKDNVAYTNTEEQIPARKVIWAAGIQANTIEGLPEEAIGWGRRIKVNAHCQVEGYEDIFAIGDVAYMEEPNFQKGHPQVAQVAIQMGKYLSSYFKQLEKGKPQQDFRYNDPGSMATIGRNRAVVDLPKFKFQGFFAWIVWLLVHLFSLIGTKNKLFVFMNWLISYFSYDQSLRLIIRTGKKK